MKRLFLTIAITLSATILFAQSITNVNAIQRTDGSMIVDITYDLSGPEPEYFTEVEISFDGGYSFTRIGKGVTGDIGPGIVPGNGKAMELDLGMVFPNHYSASTQIRIVANSEWTCGMTIFDERDSKRYTTKKIGSQCWMSENLNIGTMINSSRGNITRIAIG